MILPEVNTCVATFWKQTQEPIASLVSEKGIIWYKKGLMILMMTARGGLVFFMSVADAADANWFFSPTWLCVV